MVYQLPLVNWVYKDLRGDYLHVKHLQQLMQALLIVTIIESFIKIRSITTQSKV